MCVCVSVNIETGWSKLNRGRSSRVFEKRQIAMTSIWDLVVSTGMHNVHPARIEKSSQLDCSIVFDGSTVYRHALEWSRSCRHVLFSRIPSLTFAQYITSLENSDSWPNIHFWTLTLKKYFSLEYKQQSFEIHKY